MCGYFGNLHESPVVINLFNQLGIPLTNAPPTKIKQPQFLPVQEDFLSPSHDENNTDNNPFIGQFYPRDRVANLITHEDGQFNFSEALWWYQLRYSHNGLIADESITSFNARELHKPLWRDAIRYRRGLIIATEIGESQEDKRYLMKSDNAFGLGVIYKDWKIDNMILRSMAVITRPPHERLSLIHI